MLLLFFLIKFVAEYEKRLPCQKSKMKIWISIILFNILPMSVFSQSFSSLWSKYEKALADDLPKTQLEVLDQLVEKAGREKAYGQLMKARLCRVQAVTAVTPDSLEIEVERLVEAEKKALATDPVLAAVCQSVLGNVYANNSIGENPREVSEAYFKQSLAKPELLAGVKAEGYVPLVVQGDDSKYFDNDLLSVLGFEAKDYELLYRHYDEKGNPKAACLVAAYMMRYKMGNALPKIAGSDYLAELDALIAKYRDLDVAGELALVKYDFLTMAHDATIERKIAFIDESMEQWKDWPRIQQLANAKQGLICPQYSLDFGCRVVLPQHERKVDLYARNLKSITMKVVRVDIDPKENYYLNDDKVYRKVKGAAVKGTEWETTKHFDAHPDYESFRDSIVLKPLPLGVYLMEFVTDNKAIATEKAIFYVSDVYLLQQSLPSEKTRLVAVSATTGQPLKNARLTVFSYKNQSNYKFDSKGELVLEGDENFRYGSRDYYVYTNVDKFSPKNSVWRQNYSFSTTVDKMRVRIYTDRSIYRPGQTVHAALLCFDVKAGLESKAVEGRKLPLTLLDANGKEVEKKEVVTDAFGKASADFILPQSGLTGVFRLSSERDNTVFRVEEYKRPTFEVEIPAVKDTYREGDTLMVKGIARTYVGVPVQGATVAYSVSRQLMSWWGYANDSGEDVLVTDSVVTDAEGAFMMRVPIVLPSNVDADDLDSWRAKAYRIVADAIVTDQAGESHEASISLPISAKTTFFSFDMPSQMERREVEPVTFILRNVVGEPVEGNVTYYVDDEPQAYTAKANEQVTLPMDGALGKSGEHSIKAICNGDTIKREFVIFSVDDKRPCKQTHAWFYASDSQFTEGEPVYVQVGSSDPNTVVFYNVFSEDKILEQGSFKLNNANQNRKWTYKKEYGTGILLTYALVKEGVAYVYRHSIRRPMPDKRILLTWETFRDRLTPGEEEEWTLKATYPDGSPADAQMMATIYDQSLDQISFHSWGFWPGIGVNLPSTGWKDWSYNDYSLHAYQRISPYRVPSLRFSSFDSNLFSFWGSRRREYRLRGRNLARVDTEGMVEAIDMEESMVAMAPMEDALNSNVAGMQLKSADRLAEVPVKVQKASEEKQDADKGGAVQIRENLDETAAFIPMAVADANGIISLKFKLPESVTTWKVMGLATDKLLNHGSISGEAVAKKDIMVMPNMPRFVRLGDKAQVSARLVNTVEHDVAGKARIEIVEPETDKVVYSKSVNFTTKAGQTSSVTFDYEPKGMPGLLVCRIYATGEGFSDGEQHYLPVLSNMELVTRTVPFTQHKPQVSTFDLTKLFPATAKDGKLTIEYTNNPAWLMIQALPTMAAGNSENAITQATSYYANTLGQYLMNLSPLARKTVDAWRNETTEVNSLTSNLEKNEELKDLLISETPWVPEADKEGSQKRSLCKFFDERTIDIRLSSALDKLRELQNGDGSWSWWKGMDGSIYMTAEVAEMFVRLNRMVGEQSNSKEMLDKAFDFMGKFIIEEVEELKKLEKKGHKNLLPSEAALSVLYNMALDGRQLSKSVQAAADFLVGRFAAKTSEFTIFGKARAAVILDHFGKKDRARLYLKSLDEYSVATQEMGRYYDTRKAYYSWRSYGIPTEVAAIEAFKRLQPENKTVVDEMRIWLLQQKRAQMWDTPVNSVDAIYAFLEGNANVLETGVQSNIRIDGQRVDLSEATAGLGYVKEAVKMDGQRKLEVDKTSEGTSWGALYAQFMQPVADVENLTAGLSVKRELLAPAGKLHVGDKVVVRITIKAERDLDFVEVIDRRAACLEPVKQLSGYHYGYYIAPKDYTTAYYFNKMFKGTHVIETEYYVDRKGTYTSGSCKVQCAYAPEFSATGKALRMEVVE